MTVPAAPPPGASRSDNVASLAEAFRSSLGAHTASTASSNAGAVSSRFLLGEAPSERTLPVASARFPSQPLDMVYCHVQMTAYSRYFASNFNPVHVESLNSALVPSVCSHICGKCGQPGHWELSCEAAGEESKIDDVTLASIAIKESRRNILLSHGDDREDAKSFMNMNMSMNMNMNHTNSLCVPGAASVADEESGNKCLKVSCLKKEPPGLVFCSICKMHNPGDVVLTCDGCNNEFHSSCCGLTAEDLRALPEEWFCHQCRDCDDIGSECIIEEVEGFLIEQSKDHREPATWTLDRLVLTTARGGGPLFEFEDDEDQLAEEEAGAPASSLQQRQQQQPQDDSDVEETGPEGASTSASGRLRDASPRPRSSSSSSRSSTSSSSSSSVGVQVNVQAPPQCQPQAPKRLFSVPVVTCSSCGVSFPFVTPPHAKELLWGVNTYSSVCESCGGREPPYPSLNVSTGRWVDCARLAILNLMVKKEVGDDVFFTRQELVDFINQNWDALRGDNMRPKYWEQDLSTTMKRYSNLFRIVPTDDVKWSVKFSITLEGIPDSDVAVPVKVFEHFGLSGEELDLQLKSRNYDVQEMKLPDASGADMVVDGIEIGAAGERKR